MSSLDSVRLTIYTKFLTSSQIMQKKIFLLLFILLVNMRCSIPVTNDIKKSEYQTLFKLTLRYIFKSQHLPPDYYNQPLKIINMQEYPLSKPLIINGKQCIILPFDTNVMDLLAGTDIFKPVPVVKISEFRVQGMRANLSITLRATGHNYIVTIKKANSHTYVVTNLIHRTL
jgi:hypothetical protein